MADFNFVTGVGQATGPDPAGTMPTVGISWSNDGGFVYGNEMVRSSAGSPRRRASSCCERADQQAWAGAGGCGCRAESMWRFLGATQDTALNNH